MRDQDVELCAPGASLLRLVPRKGPVAVCAGSVLGLEMYCFDKETVHDDSWVGKCARLRNAFIRNL